MGRELLLVVLVGERVLVGSKRFSGFGRSVGSEWVGFCYIFCYSFFVFRFFVCILICWGVLRCYLIVGEMEGYRVGRLGFGDLWLGIRLLEGAGGR